MTGTAIRVSVVSKSYQIYERPQDRLKQAIIPRLGRYVGRTRLYYREFRALSEVSFEVKKGETVGIIGRNGSGKSTLLQIICGTLTPTQGTVETNGRVAALLELGSGFNPEFTGRENVYLYAAVLGLTRAQIDARFDEIAAFADIGEFIEQPIKTYSSGMAVRLAFAVIVHVDADILVVDEALAVGDAFFTQKCMRFLRDFQARGTLLFVSHDAGAVTGLCERAIWLDRGEVCAEGAAKEVMNQYLEAFAEDATGRKLQRRAEPKAQNDQRALRDVRAEMVKQSALRNDIIVPPFDPTKSSFGEMEAEIVDVLLVDESGARMSTVCGGEMVVLEIVVRAQRQFQAPIVGFYIKDRLGQMLFGDNTYVAYHDHALSISTGQSFRARFSFVMPRLMAGDYFITAGVAEGTQHEHFIQHWIHEALLLRSVASDLSAGIIGLPMQSIDMEVIG